ncbi:MAG TPA: AAA family ATPase [Vicinamibacteria bacterium]|nr:AAA family ATPase [Vicinamibacteria bacterium]
MRAERNPFIAGSWVRGDNFFGRTAILREIMEGERDSLWVVGARRLGKTSLLKELEYRIQRHAQTEFVPLFWDLQGSGDVRGLADNLLGSVEDSESFRRATSVGVEDLEGLAVFDMLTNLLRRTVRSGWRLLLLVDEAEEFLTVARQDPAVLPRLRRILQKGPELRTVLTSTRRLARLDERTDFDTSPFLLGFIPPLYLTPLAPEEARALLARGRFTEEETSTIMERTASHPFLLQLIASRLYESRDLAATLNQVAADEMVANFFSVDFQTLEPVERQLVEEAARAGGRTRKELVQAAGSTEERIEPLLFGLSRMGYLSSADGGSYHVGNWFFERWLRRGAESRAGEARTV